MWWIGAKKENGLIEIEGARERQILQQVATLSESSQRVSQDLDELPLLSNSTMMKIWMCVKSKFVEP